MIRRKLFYSTIQTDGITGIKKQYGYELRIDGELFNAYYSEKDNRVYIIDPKNGIALHVYDEDENEDELLLEIDLIEKAKEKFLQSANLSRWKEKRDNESYRLLEKMFKAYKRAESLRESALKTLFFNAKVEGAKYIGVKRDGGRE